MTINNNLNLKGIIKGMCIMILIVVAIVVAMVKCRWIGSWIGSWSKYKLLRDKYKYYLNNRKIIQNFYDIFKKSKFHAKWFVFRLDSFIKQDKFLFLLISKILRLRINDIFCVCVLFYSKTCKWGCNVLAISYYIQY